MLKEKDIKFISKQFSMKSKSLLNISNIYMGFIKGDTGRVLSSKIEPWGYFSEEVQTLLMKNFKKAYSGKPDIKMFAPEFTETTLQEDDTMYSIITDIDTSTKNEFLVKCDMIAELIGETHIYEENVTLLAMNGSIHKDGVARNIFVATICKVKQGEVNFIYKLDKDDEERGLEEKGKFELISSMDCVINSSSPLDALTYPILTDGTAIRNQIGYYSSKSNKPNTTLISKVLGCDVKLTAQQEDIFFTKILNTITNCKMAGKDLFNFYSYLRDTATNTSDDDEDVFIEKFDIDKAFEKCNIDKIVSVDDAFEKVFGFENYSFKIQNVLPPTEKKSISISNDDVSIKIKPETLQNLKQIQDETGQVFLMVPMSENATTNGFELPIEALDTQIDTLENNN